MAYRGTTTRGTPYTKVGPTTRQGQAAGKPSGFSGTQPEGMTSDNRGYQSNPKGGTPYISRNGNPDDARRVVSNDKYGQTSDHGNQNDPASNGPSTMLDVRGYESGFQAPGAPSMDSPVPGSAPTFDPGFIPTQGRGRLGAAPSNDLAGGGGVMSRGMLGTSTPSGPEDELIRDDSVKG